MEEVFIESQKAKKAEVVLNKTTCILDDRIANSYGRDF